MAFVFLQSDQTIDAVITLNLTDREAAILYMKFDMFINGDSRNKILGAIFGKLEQSLLARQNQDYARKELRFNILTALQMSQPAHLRR